MSAIESIKHSNCFDIIQNEINIKDHLKALCKPEKKYNEFVKNENIWHFVNKASQVLSYFILPAVITIPLYFWSKRKLEVISAAKDWNQVNIAFKEKNWDNAIIYLKKLHTPIVQDNLDKVNSFSQYQAHKDIPFISSEAAEEASNEKEYDNLISFTGCLLTYAHLSKASEEFQRQFPNNVEVKFDNVNESVWRNVLRAWCYLGRVRCGGGNCPKTFERMERFLEATKHL
jgi:hypothetical protein